MPTATLPVATRPLPKIPSNVNSSNVWRDAKGILEQRDVVLPVDPATYRINGVPWACPMPDCAAGEWVIGQPPGTEPKNRGCAAHVVSLVEMPLDDTERDPIPGARQRMLARISRHVAAKRDAAAQRIRAEMQRQIAEARGGIITLARDMVGGAPHKGHLPSIGATLAIEAGVLYTVDLAGAAESIAIGTTIGSWGAIVGYFLAVFGQKKWIELVRRQEWIGRKAERADRRGRYVGKALAGTGLLLAALGAIEGTAGLDLTVGWQAGLVGVLTLGLAWLVNRDHWDRLWAARRRLRELAEENARRAAEAEAARLAREAQLLREQAALREQLAEVGAYDENDPLHQGERMRIEWERISNLPTADAGFPKIKKTRILPDQTREITAPDPDNPKKKVRIGWEYLGACDPGALVANGASPPVLAAKEWIVSVLFGGQFDASAISILDKPGNRQNTFLIMITDRARLGQAVPWKPETAVQISDGGDLRTGYLGRSLTGDELEEILYTRGQPFGGIVTGTSGGGKGGFAVRYILNLLFARMFPVLVDPKELADYGDFVGIFPIGWTKRHRRMILEFLHLERKRRQKVVASTPKTNRYGSRITGESKWQHRHADGSIDKIVIGADGRERNLGLGEPIASIWDEFHDQAKDDKFVLNLCNHMRFQRVAGMGALLLSQGGGLEDWGNSVLRDLGNQCSLTSFRAGDMQSRLAGNRNAAYSTADLPMVAGMCLRQAVGSPQIPLRAAFITRDAEAEDTVYTVLWGKGVTPELQIEDPMSWISEETIEIMKETGVWDLWMLGKEGGIDAILADNAEDEDDDEQAFLDFGKALAMPQNKALVSQIAKPMEVRDVLLAILHETPGLDIKGIAESGIWARAGREAPDESSITRAARTLDPTVNGRYPLPEGMIQKIDRGPNSKSWTLTAQGAALGAEMAARLAPAGSAQAAPVHPMAPPEGGAAALAEMAAFRAAELAKVIAEETRLVK